MYILYICIYIVLYILYMIYIYIYIYEFVMRHVYTHWSLANIFVAQRRRSKSEPGIILHCCDMASVWVQGSSETPQGRP